MTPTSGEDTARGPAQESLTEQRCIVCGEWVIWDDTPNPVHNTCVPIKAERDRIRDVEAELAALRTERERRDGATP